MKKFKKLMLVSGVTLLLGAGSVLSYLQAQRPKTLQENLTLANIEALAEGEGDETGMVVKRCYMTFSNDYDGDYYATCSQVASNPQIMFQCGAVSSKKPAWGVTTSYYCYEPAYQG